jgi:hypothetical protein
LRILGSVAAGRPLREFDTVILEPHGGDLIGFVLLRGTREQLDEIGNDEEFDSTIAWGALVVKRIGVVRATLGDGLGQ